MKVFALVFIVTTTLANGEGGIGSGEAGEAVATVNSTLADADALAASFNKDTDCRLNSTYMNGALEQSPKAFESLLLACANAAEADKKLWDGAAGTSSPFMAQFDCHTYEEVEQSYQRMEGNDAFETWNTRKGCSGILFDEYWGGLPLDGTPENSRHFRDSCPVQMRDANPGMFVAYLFALVYFFGGVGAAADMFMGAIEAMTAVTRTVKRDDGSHVEILVWNKTVSNLSLMALGSSAPEIMLAVVGIIGNDYRAEDLGPGTIVGSAAFNMLMIIAICVSITPSKIVEEINVLYITAFFSVWAYIWLYIICEVWSPEEITIEEGVITCVQFPVLLLIAWFADRGWFDSDVVSHKIKRMTSTGINDPEEKLALERVVSVGGMTVRAAGTSEWNKEFRKMIKKCTKEHPSMSRDEVYVLAFEQLKHHHMAPHVEDEGIHSEVIHVEEGSEKYMVRRSSSTKAVVGNTLVGFKVTNTTTTKGAKEVVLTIGCIGAHPNRITVAFKTVPETAKEGVHYAGQRGVVVFPPLVQESFTPDGSPISVDETVTITLPAQPDYDLTRYFKVVLACGAEVDYIRNSKETSVEVVNSYETTGCFDSVCKGFSYFFMSILGEDESENAWLEQIRQSFRWEEDDDDDEEEDDEEDEALKRTSMSAEPKIFEEMTLQITQFSPDVAKHIEGVVAGEVDVDAAIDAMPEFDDEQGEEKTDDESHGVLGYVYYCYMILPRVALALTVPPTEWLSGILTFIFSLGWIAVFTMICGDLATGLGCTVNLKDTVTAITFVALGTSVPDTFASKIAAEQDRNADPAIGNVTGSNAVNVFLGVGLSWLIGAVYQFKNMNCDESGKVFGKGEGYMNRCKFMVPPSKSLGFSVVLFSVMAGVWFSVLMLRRKFLGGELGGHWGWKTATWILFVLMWIIFVILVALVEYGKISPGF